MGSFVLKFGDDCTFWLDFYIVLNILGYIAMVPASQCCCTGIPYQSNITPTQGQPVDVHSLKQGSHTYFHHEFPDFQRPFVTNIQWFSMTVLKPLQSYFSKLFSISYALKRTCPCKIPSSPIQTLYTTIYFPWLSRPGKRKFKFHDFPGFPWPVRTLLKAVFVSTNQGINPYLPPTELIHSYQVCGTHGLGITVTLR